MEKEFRIESDSIGELEVPVSAYYGVQSLRGYKNFNISGRTADIRFIYNIVRIKKASATVNKRLKSIKENIADAIVLSCDEILSGKFDGEFITDAIQGGAGTTFNMNVNEVIANRATEILGGKKGEYLCHPNDDVNCSESTNDVIPSAGKLTVIELTDNLILSLDNLVSAIYEKEKEFDCIVKMGRTQLQDAVPIRLGQEFGAYACAVKRCKKRIKDAVSEMYFLNLGGTAIGTKLNAKTGYSENVIKELSLITGRSLTSSENFIDGTQNTDCFSYFSGALKTLAITLSKICNDLRLLSSGPKTGIGEITLPAMQNGSSIMPGKVNPVIPEVVNQIAFNVLGNDYTVSLAVEAGQLELNAFEPIIFFKLFESLTTLTNGIKTLTDNCIKGITANKERCESLLNESVGIITALAPFLGYKTSATLAKEALKKNVKIKDLILEKKLLDKGFLDNILNPYNMT